MHGGLLGLAMKTVLAFGDSLTRSARLPEERQWPALAERELRGLARVVNEGLGGRTTASDVAGDTTKNGLRALPACLREHGPIDLLVVMLGSNDLKPEVAGTAEIAVEGMSRLIESMGPAQLQHPAMRLMLVAPPIFGPSDLAGGGPRGGRSIEESKKLAGLYERLAVSVGADFADASRYATTTRRDGVHLDEEQTARLALGLSAEIRRVISRSSGNAS